MGLGKLGGIARPKPKRAPVEAKFNSRRTTMKTIRHLTMKLFAAALLITCVCAGAANAEPLFKGKVNLPTQVRWGKAILPAGEYWVTLNSPSLPALLTIRTTDGKRTVFVMPAEINRSNVKGTSAVVLHRRGNQATVQTLRITEAGLVLRYAPQKFDNKEMEEAGATQEVPVLAAHQ